MPLAHLDRLIQWAQILRVPADRLWFAIPSAAVSGGEERNVNRRELLLTSAGLTVASGLTNTQRLDGDEMTGQKAVEWLAWHLWQRRSHELHRSRITTQVIRYLDAHPHVIRQPNDLYRFADPTLVDLLVAQRVFGGIATGSGHLLATAQTSHTMDLTIGALAADDLTAQRRLVAWMRGNATAVLRVNAAGILAKVGPPDLGDAAILTLREDSDVRRLYLTAVASRVLSTPWEQASQLAEAAVNATPSEGSLFEGGQPWIAERLASELTNNRDAAARWCSTLFLSNLPGSMAVTILQTIARTARNEPCRENLRAYAAVLAGASPTTS
jgi:hypothetical protein